MKFIIGLGGNLGDSARILADALLALEKQGIVISKKSSLYQTKPWGLTEQPTFYNAVVEVEWDKSPEMLLQEMLAVEKLFGRTREIHWGPRTLDLDLIYAEGVELDTAFLCLPHPYFWERPFVLVPLAEIIPDFTFKGESISDRIEKIDGNKEVKKLTTSGWNKEDQ